MRIANVAKDTSKDLYFKFVCKAKIQSRDKFQKSEKSKFVARSAVP